MLLDSSSSQPLYYRNQSGLSVLSGLLTVSCFLEFEKIVSRVGKKFRVLRILRFDNKPKQNTECLANAMLINPKDFTYSVKILNCFENYLIIETKYF